MENTTKRKKGLPKIIKLIIKIVCVLAVVAVAYFCYIKFFKSSDVKMESISQSLEEIKEISEFCTANYFDEILFIDSIPGRIFGYNKMVMTAKGQIRAGFDLTDMETEISDESINIIVSPAKILDTITNPSGFKTVSESGSWSHERVTEARNKARIELVKHAIAEGVLTTAEENGIRLLNAMFSSFGFKDVSVTIRQKTSKKEEKQEKKA